MKKSSACVVRGEFICRRLSRACLGGLVCVFFLAWIMDVADMYIWRAKPPFLSPYEWTGAGRGFLLFILVGCGICGLLYMCSTVGENWRKRCRLWAIVQLIGAQVMSIPIIHFFGWGSDGAEACVLFYGAPLITGLSLGAAIWIASRYKSVSLRCACVLRTLCLILLTVGAIITVFSIERIS